jgi:hypothetical protein
MKLSPFPIFSLAGLAGASALVGSFVVGLSLMQATPSVAQTQAVSNAENRCILAGHLDEQARWSPALRHVELFDAQGNALQVLAGSEAKASLDKVKQVRIKAPALLSTCNGTQAIAKGEDGAGAPKAMVPAVSAGNALIAVESVNLPAGRNASQWVELKLALASDRVAMIRR